MMVATVGVAKVGVAELAVAKKMWQKDVTKKRWLKRQMEVATVGWQKKGGQKEVAEKR